MCDLVSEGKVVIHILGCLPGMPGPGRNSAAREASEVVLDMTAVVNIIKPQRASVFGKYTEMQLLLPT